MLPPAGATVVDQDHEQQSCAVEVHASQCLTAELSGGPSGPSAAVICWTAPSGSCRAHSFVIPILSLFP